MFPKTPVSALWGYDWDYCWFDSVRSVSRCQIFDKGGGIIYEDIFLPYEGQGPTSADELKVSARQDGGGYEWIRLENGTILIPRSSYDKIKRGLDWEKGRRSTR